MHLPSNLPALCRRRRVQKLAVFAGVVTAAAIKLSFSGHEEAPESNESKMAQLRAAATDPLYLADMQEVNDDFARAA